MKSSRLGVARGGEEPLFVDDAGGEALATERNEQAIPCPALQLRVHLAGCEFILQAVSCGLVRDPELRTSASVGHAVV